MEKAHAPKTEKLYTPGSIGNMKLKNRWIMLAMHTGYANDDGSFSRRDMEFYARRAKGGMAAITLVGAVNEAGARHGMYRFDRNDSADDLKLVCDIIHGGDCKVIMQLYHAGRNNADALHLGPPLAPSPIPSPIYKVMPKEMSEKDIFDTIDAFSKAAYKCKNSGVDCVEVSGSVGYLLSEFLSPRTNVRTDQWGGDEIKRMKFPTEVLKEIRQAVGDDYPVIIKISGGDMLGGYENDYMAKFINQLPEGILDGVTVTGGWHEAPVPQISYHVTPGGFSYLAKEIKEKTGLTVIGCNRINSPEVAERLLEEGDCDFAGAARPFLADPDFVNKSRSNVPYNRCQACNKGCIENALKKKDVCCVFNPKAGREYLENNDDSIGANSSHKNKKVLVVGAGPVGMEAAKSASEKGFNVTLITDENRLGGKLNIACKPPFKQGFSSFINYMEYELKRLKVRIMFSTPVTKELVNEVKPDIVIFAVGASPIIPEIEGIHQFPFVTAESVLGGKSRISGDNITVLGGGSVGLETAEFLAVKYPEKKITVIEKLSKAGKDLGGLKWIMMKHLKELNVEILTSAQVVKCDEKGLLIRTEVAGERYIPTDIAVFAVGCKPRGTLKLEEYLDEENIKYYILGDGGKTANIMDGMSEAYNLFS